MSEVYDKRKQLTAGIPTFSMRPPDARVAGEAPFNDPHAKAGAITLTDGHNLTVDVGCGHSTLPMVCDSGAARMLGSGNALRNWREQGALRDGCLERYVVKTRRSVMSPLMTPQR